MIVGRTINYRMLRNPVAAHRARRSIWTPAAIFAQGQQGVWYEPKPQYLFQDAAGTVPVTADGDPVGYMQDLSGNGNHATQSVDLARPLYRTDGALHWLEFDGVDDRYDIQGVVDGQGCGTLAFAIRPDPTADSWSLLGTTGVGPFGFVATDGHTSAPFRRYGDKPTIWINNTAEPDLNMGTFFTAAQGANVIAGRGGSYGHQWATPSRYLMQSVVGGYFKGRYYGAVEVLGNDISDDDFALLVDHLQRQMP